MSGRTYRGGAAIYPTYGSPANHARPVSDGGLHSPLRLPTGLTAAYQRTFGLLIRTSYIEERADVCLTHFSVKLTLNKPN